MARTKVSRLSQANGRARIVRVLLVIVMGLDWRLEGSKDSVGQALSRWSSRHVWWAIGLTAFYGFLLANLFTKDQRRHTAAEERIETADPLFTNQAAIEFSSRFSLSMYSQGFQ